MKKMFLALAATTMLGFGLAAGPASALPAGIGMVEAPTALVEARGSRSERMMMSRKRMKRGHAMRGHRMHHRRSMRRGSMRGSGVMSTQRTMRGGDPNAESPSRAPGQQRTGQTTGGSAR